jgi:hypothetical protein
MRVEDTHVGAELSVKGDSGVGIPMIQGHGSARPQARPVEHGYASLLAPCCQCPPSVRGTEEHSIVCASCIV